MKISQQDFKNHPQKAITLIGMSGAGKTHISAQLESWGWYNYSCDFVIGADYLKDKISPNMPFTVDNIGALSDYLGKLGNPDLGGFDLKTFRERQKAYYDAEVQALEAMGRALKNAKGDFVHDSTGSLCEIEDEALLDKIGKQTLFVYLKAAAEDEQEVLKRARDYPKPLFFPPAFFDANLAQYLKEFGLSSVAEIVPNDFSRWVFPLLFEARKPKYQRLADLYGVTIPASEFRTLRSTDEFIDIISKHLNV